MKKSIVALCLFLCLSLFSEDFHHGKNIVGTSVNTLRMKYERFITPVHSISLEYSLPAFPYLFGTYRQSALIGYSYNIQNPGNLFSIGINTGFSYERISGNIIEYYTEKYGTEYEASVIPVVVDFRYLRRLSDRFFFSLELMCGYKYRLSYHGDRKFISQIIYLFPDFGIRF